MNTRKIKAFEYLIYRLLEWANECKPKVNTTSFTRLKILKLLFLVSACSDKNGNDLLDLFDAYYALPNGPVESDVYNSITADTLIYYSFKNFSIAKKNSFDIHIMDKTIVKRIDNSIENLRAVNPNAIAYSAEQLVELTHRWNVWKSSNQIARLLGKGSYPMNTYLIRNSNKEFVL